MSSREDTIQALVGVREPYGRPSAYEQAIFDAAMIECDRWHLARNPSYARLWVDIVRPTIPVGLFKAVDLHTPVAGEGTWLTSTGTSGGPRTKIFFDSHSMARIGAAMLQIFVHARYFDIAPARFLLLAPDPARARDLPGYATAFQKFTGCAPVAERVHVVSETGAFLAELAWDTLARWAEQPGTVFIFGLTVYLERLVASAPREVPQKGMVKALTGGGWKGLEQVLTRDQMVERLRAFLPAPVCDVRDLFGLTEHPLHYMSCEEGQFHLPKYSRVSVLGPEGAPRALGQRGLIRLQNPFFASIPSHDLCTEDQGVLEEDCPCGVPGVYLRFLGRLTTPGGTCAANAARALTA